MNLAYLFEIQAGLDAHIEQEHPRQDGEDRLSKKILALQVELGELANEWRGFKFWKVNRQPVTFERLNKKCTYCKGTGRKVINPGTLENKMVDCEKCVGGWQYTNPLLEEYVDCLHFILSIGLEVNARNLFADEVNFNIGSRTKKSNALESFKNVYKEIHYLANGERSSYMLLVTEFTTLGDALGFTEQQIEQAYLEKNKVNHERQVNGY